MRVLEIPRDRWVRGFWGQSYDEQNRMGPSSLLNKEGNQCCVGHYLTACGLADDVIKGRAAADDLVDIPEEARWLVHPDEPGNRSDDAQSLYRLNDQAMHDRGMAGLDIADEVDRETRIAKIFARHDAQVVFK